MSWMRYPGRLAHLMTERQSLWEGDPPRRVGTEWHAPCSRRFRLYWTNERQNPVYVSPADLRAETPRGWCLRCGYWAMYVALVLPERDFGQFVADVASGRSPVAAMS